MEHNTCGNYTIDGTFIESTKNKEYFGNSQSNYVELDKIAIPNQNKELCDPYNPDKPYDLCFLESTFKNNICKQK